MARRHGTVTMVGMGRAEHTVTFSMLQLLMEEKRFLPSLYGSSQARRDLPRFVSLVETGRLDLNTMVSRRIKLDDVNDAFRAMSGRRGHPLRHRVTGARLWFRVSCCTAS